MLVSEGLYLGLDHGQRREDLAVQVFEVIVERKSGLLVLELVEGTQFRLLVYSTVKAPKLSSELSKGMLVFFQLTQQILDFSMNFHAYMPSA